MERQARLHAAPATRRPPSYTRPKSAHPLLGGRQAGGRAQAGAKELRATPPRRPMSAAPPGAAAAGRKAGQEGRLLKRRNSEPGGPPKAAGKREGDFDNKKPYKVYADGKIFKQMGEKWYQLGKKQMFHRVTFNQMDTDRSGQLDLEEFQRGFKYEQFGLTKEEMVRAFRVFDRDDSGEVDVAEFLDFLDRFEPLNPNQEPGCWPWVEEARTPRPVIPVRDAEAIYKEKPSADSYEESQMMDAISAAVQEKFRQKDSKIRLTFRRMDVDQNGTIDEEEFLRGLQGMELGLSQAQLKLLFQIVDVDKSGDIDYEEFLDRYEKYTPLDEPGYRPDQPVARGNCLPEPSRTAHLDSAGIKALRDKIPRYMSKLTSSCRAWDASKNGHIRYEHLKRALLKLESQLTEKEVETLVETYNPGGRKKMIFYRDFIRFVVNSDTPELPESQRLIGSLPVPRSVPEEKKRGPMPFSEMLQNAIHERQGKNVYRGTKRMNRTQRFAHTPRPNTFGLMQPQADAPAYGGAADRSLSTTKRDFVGKSKFSGRSRPRLIGGGWDSDNYGWN